MQLIIESYRFYMNTEQVLQDTEKYNLKRLLITTLTASSVFVKNNQRPPSISNFN